MWWYCLDLVYIVVVWYVVRGLHNVVEKYKVRSLRHPIPCACACALLFLTTHALSLLMNLDLEGVYDIQFGGAAAYCTISWLRQGFHCLFLRSLLPSTLCIK